MALDSRTDLPGGVNTKSCYINVPSADLLTDTAMGTQALCGQRFELIEIKDGRAIGALRSILPGTDRIDYIGTLPRSALSVGVLNPTHVVSAVLAPCFKDADIKSPVLRGLPRNSYVEAVEEGDFIKLAQGGFIHSRHIRCLTKTISRDFTDYARDMLNLPYIWGGTGHVGVDCSGLVQSALAACGFDAPRDADQQERQLGSLVEFSDRASGDLLFWPGHVGIVVEDDTLLHANAHHMSVVLEPVERALARIGPVRTTKRL